jgi:hypothetical protein
MPTSDTEVGMISWSVDTGMVAGGEQHWWESVLLTEPEGASGMPRFCKAVLCREAFTEAEEANTT